jgi:hypothetical protein
MTSTSGGVAVIATQVARTDRRALSEAWYSALHAAHGKPAAHVLALQRPASPLTLLHGPHTLSSCETPVPIATPIRHRVRHDVAADFDAAPERRRPACETSRRIERAVTTLATRPSAVTAHTVDVAGGRVRLLVRSDRSATRIIAVCSSPLREPVERALAHARFALAGARFAVGAP